MADLLLDSLAGVNAGVNLSECMIVRPPPQGGTCHVFLALLLVIEVEQFREEVVLVGL